MQICTQLGAPMLTLSILIYYMNKGSNPLSDSSVNFAVRAWVKSSDYWDVFFSMNEKIYNTFEKEHLEIPYPTMNVNLSKLN